MSAMVVVAGLLLQVVTLDDVLRGLEEGAPPPAPLPAPLAAEAVSRIEADAGATLDAARLARLIEVARSSPRTAQPLAKALVGVVGHGGELAEVAVPVLAAAPRASLPAAVPPAVVDRLVERLEADDAGAPGAARLLGRWAPPARLSALLQAWQAEPAARARCAEALLGELPANAAPPAALLRTLQELGEGEGLAAWTRPLGAAAFELTRRDPDAALEVVALGERGPCGAFLHGLGGVGLASAERWERARAVLADHLEARLTLPPVVVAATVRGATALLLDELLPLLQPMVMESPSPAIRVAAVEALAALGYRDRPTIDCLVALLEDRDREVAAAAYDVLRLKSGQTLPARKALWASWRATAELPEEPPDGAQERLAAQRRTRARVELKAREEAEETARRPVRAPRG